MKLYSYKGLCNCSGGNIRLARERIGLSQEGLAAKLQLLGLNVNQKAISRVETGIRVVPDYELSFYAAALEVELLWLLGQKNDPHEKITDPNQQ